MDEVEQNSVICQWRIDKSRYFARTEFNNFFIIHLHSFVLCFLRFFLQVNKTTHLPKVQQSGRHCMCTKIEGNAHAQSIICSWATFLTNAHSQTMICTQLFAGELTNQNWEYYKVNDNFSCLYLKMWNLKRYETKNSVFRVL